MEHDLVIRLTRLLACAAMVAVLPSCPGYSPAFTDCKVKCGDRSSCPTGLVCKIGFCRPASAEGSCDCVPGEERPCGGGKGECVAGVQRCTNNGSWGVCTGETKPTPELCDNKDNDCNGVADDEVTDAIACPFTRGVCGGHNQVCVGGAFSGTCELSEYGANYEAIETRCDGLDNDCDGVIDATVINKLGTSLSNYALAELDGGFALVGNEVLAAGHQVVLIPLNGAMQPRGPPITLSPVRLDEQEVVARGVGTTTYIAWADEAVDAGVNLAAVEYSGAKHYFPSYDKSEKSGPISLGANATNAMVTWPAHFDQAVRLVTWDLDSGYVARDFGTGADGGYIEWNEFYSARLSSSGLVLGWRGYNNDGGSSFSNVMTLRGTPKNSTGSLGGAYEFVELANNAVQAGWYYSSYFSFFGFPTSNESGVEFKNDVFGTTYGVIRRVPDYQAITSGTIGRGQVSGVLAWTERNLNLVVGTPYGNGAQARVRSVPSDGGLVFAPKLGNPGGSTGLIGVTWRDTSSGAGDVHGLMLCQP